MTLPKWAQWAIGIGAALVVILVCGYCYGNARAKDAVAVQTATLADSISKQYAAAEQAVADSAAARITAAQQQATAARKQATTAADSLKRVLARAANTTRLTAAQRDSLTAPVRAIVDTLISVNQALTAASTGLAAANQRLLSAVDSLTRADSVAFRALGEAKTTIAQQAVTIHDYQVVKTPSKGILYYAGETAKITAAALAGFGAGRIGH